MKCLYNISMTEPGKNADLCWPLQFAFLFLSLYVKKPAL